MYTTTNANIGNRALIYPVGLITYDELTYAGMDYNHVNKLSWVYSLQHYWTMSPSNFDAVAGCANEWQINSAGFLSYWWGVSGSIGIRPVINLKSDVKISGGTGTANNPYVVDTNK